MLTMLLELTGGSRVHFPTYAFALDNLGNDKNKHIHFEVTLSWSEHKLCHMT